MPGNTVEPQKDSPAIRQHPFPADRIYNEGLPDVWGSQNQFQISNRTLEET